MCYHRSMATYPLTQSDLRARYAYLVSTYGKAYTDLLISRAPSAEHLVTTLKRISEVQDAIVSNARACEQCETDSPMDLCGDHAEQDRYLLQLLNDYRSSLPRMHPGYSPARVLFPTPTADTSTW